MNRIDFSFGFGATIVLALAILLLFAYLGSHSRLMIDDYLHMSNGLELGPWQNVLNQRNLWNGSYTDYILHALAAPLGTLAPRIIPPIFILLWLLGLVWLIFRGLAFARIERYQRMASLALGAAIAAVTLNALLTPRAIYWLSGSLRYTLPLAVLTLFLAMTLEMIWQQWSLRWMAIAGALICFFNAGLSEMYLVVQLIFFTACLPATYLYLEGPSRRRLLTMLGAGLLASAASLVVQLSSPGVGIRAGHFLSSWGVPDRSLSRFLRKATDLVLELSIDPDIVAGFILLMALGLFAMLIVYRPTNQQVPHGPLRLAQSPLLFGLFMQLLCMPLLWNHVSDNPQLLGRFSYGFAVAIGLNLSFAISLAVLLRERSRVNRMLQQRRVDWSSALFLALLVVLLLFALTQLRSIHWRASAFIYISIHMIMIMCCWQLSLPLAKSTRLRFAGGAAYLYGATWLAIAAVSTVVFYSYVRVFPRVLSFAAYSLALQGLVWGLYLGYAINHFNGAREEGSVGRKLLCCVCLATALLIGTGIFIGQARLAPSFARYASEWDARHQDILDARDSGSSTVSVPALSFDLAKYMRLPAVYEHSLSAIFYKVDAIVLEDA